MSRKSKQVLLQAPAAEVPTQPAQTQPERLSQDDLQYHMNVIHTLQAAQAAANQWGQHLAVKYKISPQDQMTMEGFIFRNSRQTPVPQE